MHSYKLTEVGNEYKFSGARRNLVIRIKGLEKNVYDDLVVYSQNLS